MNFELLLTLSILILFGLFFGWIYSEVKLEGKFNKTINWISFPFPLFLKILGSKAHGSLMGLFLNSD